jgi:hypothetical protein
MICIVVAEEHPANKMRNDIFSFSLFMNLTVVQEIGIKFLILFGGNKVGKFINPALIMFFKLTNPLSRERLQLLVEIDSPSGKPNHLISSWFWGGRLCIDEAVNLFICAHTHSRVIYNIKIIMGKSLKVLLIALSTYLQITIVLVILYL